MATWAAARHPPRVPHTVSDVTLATLTIRDAPSVTVREASHTSGAVRPAVLMPPRMAGPMGSDALAAAVVLDHFLPFWHVTSHA